ncbi:MAG: Eco57I restriction-modification methylase domain-containing protein, partial [Limisphaerales bacterium]
MLADWQSVDFLFQLTDDEVRAASGGNQQFLYESKGKWNGAAMESYLFFAVALQPKEYTRTELSGITRAVNRLFPMPVMLLFRHGETLTLAVTNRRLHKLDESKDVLEKVTLIKDIRFANPHRAHLEILCDLSFDDLREKHDFTNFVTLHGAWQKTLDSSELNKRFFLEVANWYFWALNHIQFPKDAPKQDGKDHISVIRLITRLMFCWFIKEKGLVPEILFDERKLPQILDGFSPTKTSDKDSVFYKAILQNLFFATLNTEMDKRGWTKEEQNFMAHSLYRCRDCFQKPEEALDYFKSIPFLNGGLFECLDRREGTKESPKDIRIDGFSRRPDCQPVVPDFLFFGPERDVDLSADYGDNKFKKVKVRGLIHTLNHYKFTVAENTPIEEEIALDPELSGKVFENLLAAYNPETGATARKQTGSFYTPREIVNYMVDEALIA